MPTTAIDDKGVLSKCPQRGQTNRTPFARLDQRGRCGACKTLLTPISTPLELDSEEHFHAIVQNSAVPVLVDFWAPWCDPAEPSHPKCKR